MRTGDDAKRSGVYSCECCVCEVELKKNQSFPRCPKCMNLTVWDSVEIKAILSPKKAA